MKVLLVGEYSGVHTNLKVGLTKLGAEVLLISEGDVWKKFATDIKTYYPQNTSWRRAYNWGMYNLCREWARDADVVQFINPSYLYIFNEFSSEFAFELMKRAKVSVTVLAGCDANMSENFAKLMPKICPACLEENKYCIFKSNSVYRKYEDQFYDQVDSIVPGEWDCDILYRKYVKKYNGKMESIIPYPIDCNKIRPPYEKHSRIVVHSPLNRACKGTSDIKRAFAELYLKYGETVSFEICGRMPIKEYLKYLDGIDIIVDGVSGYSYGLGMSCLLAMAKGKIAVGTRELIEKSEENSWLLESPQVDSGEGTAGIVEAVEGLIANPDRISVLQRESRKYIRKYHNATTVAKRYMELYRKLLRS